MLESALGQYAYSKLVAVASFGGVILAQDLPPGLEWAKLPIEVACVGALFWVVTKTLPSLFERQLTSQEKQGEEWRNKIAHLADAHRDTVREFTADVSSRIEKQTETITSVLTAIGKK